MVRVRVVPAVAVASATPPAAVVEGSAITTPVGMCDTGVAATGQPSDNLIWQ